MLFQWHLLNCETTVEASSLFSIAFFLNAKACCIVVVFFHEGVHATALFLFCILLSATFEVAFLSLFFFFFFFSRDAVTTYFC